MELGNFLVLGATRDFWFGPHRDPGIVKQQTTTWCPLEVFHHSVVRQKLTSRSSCIAQHSWWSSWEPQPHSPLQSGLRSLGLQLPKPDLCPSMSIFMSLMQDTKKLWKEKEDCAFHKIKCIHLKSCPLFSFFYFFKLKCPFFFEI